NRRGPRRFRVAQIGNLLFRRLAVGRRRRITNPRHSRLPVCATGVAVLVRCAVAVNTYLPEGEGQGEGKRRELLSRPLNHSHEVKSDDGMRRKGTAILAPSKGCRVKSSRLLRP